MRDRRRVHCVIPARYGSTRLPGKPLVDLCGKPMIVRSWERVRQDLPNDQITVATDDERIQKACCDYGIEAAMTSEACRTGTDRAAEVARDRDDVDIWVVAMGDNPLLPSGVVSAVIEGLRREHDAAMGRGLIRSATELRDTTTQKMAFTPKGRLLYVSRLPIPWTPHPWPMVYYKAVNVFAIWHDALRDYATWPSTPCETREGLEILRFVELDRTVQTVEVCPEGWSVDLPADVERTRKALRK